MKKNKRNILAIFAAFMLTVAIAAAGISSVNTQNIAKAYDGDILEVEDSKVVAKNIEFQPGDNLRGQDIVLIMNMIDYQAMSAQGDSHVDCISLNDGADCFSIIEGTPTKTGAFELISNEDIEAMVAGTAFSFPDDKDYILDSHFVYHVAKQQSETLYKEYISPMKGVDNAMLESFDIESADAGFANIWPDDISGATAVYPYSMESDDRTLSLIIRVPDGDDFKYIELNYVTLITLDEDGYPVILFYDAAQSDPYTSGGLTAALFVQSADMNPLTNEAVFNGYLVFYDEIISVYGYNTDSVGVDVSYDTDGTVVTEKYVTGATAENKTIAAKPNYNAIGWTVDGEAYDFDTELTEDITLTAAYELTAVDVTFELDTPVVVQTVIGQAVVAPTAPEKVGYTFAGWYTDEELTEAFDLETEIEAAMSIYPKYTLNSYDVTFELETPVVAVVHHGESTAKPADPVKTGYAFVGWFADEELTEAFDFETNITADTSVYPKFELKTYTVTFDDGSEELKTVTVNYGDTIEAPETAPEKDGYNFIGWVDADGEAFDFEEIEIVENITLTAEFEATWQTKAVEWLTPNHKWAAPTAIGVILMLAFGIAIAVKRK